MKVVLTCGGTGGHINPALAVAKRLMNRDANTEILFIGAIGGMEEDLVPREGFRLETVPVSNYQRSLSAKNVVHNVKTARDLTRAARLARNILKSFQPDVILGTGGYASYPALHQGQKLGIPTAVHEANAVPGLTTRMVAKNASRILVSYEECRDAYQTPERVVVTGMPVKEAFFTAPRQVTRRALGLDDRPVILSAFGSLGARDMNHMLTQFIRLETDLDVWQHIHATGRYGWEWMPQELVDNGVDLRLHPSIHLQEYIYNMPELMTAADLMICRAGASTLSELAAAGLPAIIVPSPNVTNNHQERNARLLEQRGAAVVLKESECSGQILFDLANELLSDQARLASMRAALREIAVPDATDRICDILEELIHTPT